MPDAQVHYEVFARSQVNAPWTLHFATEDRAKAVETAEELLTTRHAAAAKVCKETLDEETREYRSVTILAKGAVSTTAKKRPAVEDAAPLCVSPTDLYSMHARERIGRLLEGWLKRQAATAFELLHRPDLVEALESSGVELQHAIQKIAIPEAQARGATTHEMIRTFQKLVDRTMERVLRDGKAGRFPAVTPATFAEHARRLADDGEGLYLLGGGLARHIAAAPRWSGKVDRLLDLADAAPEAGRPRGLALAAVEAPLAEILALPGALSDVLGPDLDAGGSLAAMTRLAAPDAVQAVLACEPRLDRCFRPLPPAAARLARWLQDPALDGVRAGLGRRILRELKGPRRLRPADADEEILVLRGLAMGLTAASGRLLSSEDVQDAFISRSESLVRSNFVDAYVEGRESVIAEVQALVRLAENVAGSANKKAAARWISGAVTALRFEREMREGADPPAARLAGLAALQKGVRHAGLADADADALAAAIGQIGGQVEADARVVPALVRSAAPALQRLTLLLRIATGEAAPLGPAADRARAEALKLLRNPEVRAELVLAPGRLETLKDLVSRAGIAA